jgi:hypothetical protein
LQGDLSVIAVKDPTDPRVVFLLPFDQTINDVRIGFPLACAVGQTTPKIRIVQQPDQIRCSLTG